MDGLLFKSSKMSKVLHISESNIESMEKFKAAHNSEVKVIKQDGNLVHGSGMGCMCVYFHVLTYQWS